MEDRRTGDEWSCGRSYQSGKWTNRNGGGEDLFFQTLSMADSATGNQRKFPDDPKSWLLAASWFPYTKDWKAWDGKCWGYEGYLVDNYLTQLAVYDFKK